MRQNHTFPRSVGKYFLCVPNTFTMIPVFDHVRALTKIYKSFCDLLFELILQPRKGVRFLRLKNDKIVQLIDFTLSPEVEKALEAECHRGWKFRDSWRKRVGRGMTGLSRFNPERKCLLDYDGWCADGR